MTETVADEVQADEVRQDPGHRVWRLNEDDIAPTIAKLERINPAATATASARSTASPSTTTRTLAW